MGGRDDWGRENEAVESVVGGRLENKAVEGVGWREGE